jgi:hypothetical protein
MSQKDIGFFSWFCHWGIYDKNDEKVRIDDAYNLIKKCGGRHNKTEEK